MRRVVFSGLVLCFLGIVSAGVAEKPWSSSLSGFIKEFHGRVSPIASYPGANQEMLEKARERYVKYAFSVPSAGVKAALLKRFDAAKWGHSESSIGVISFKSHDGRETGFFRYGAKSYPGEPKTTTCLLFVGKPPPPKKAKKH